MAAIIRTSMLQSSKYQRYNQSCKGRQRRKNFFARYDGGKAAYERRDYHRMQEEAGCHMAPRLFYPGYRLLKALETAEVVEI